MRVGLSLDTLVGLPERLFGEGLNIECINSRQYTLTGNDHEMLCGKDHQSSIF